MDNDKGLFLLLLFTYFSEDPKIYLFASYKQVDLIQKLANMMEKITKSVG